LVEVIYPEWRMNEFLGLAVQVTFKTDASQTATRAMTTAIDDTNIADQLSQISRSFGYVSYEKGAAVLRMFQNVVGDTIWKEALHDYLQTK